MTLQEIHNSIPAEWWPKIEQAAYDYEARRRSLDRKGVTLEQEAKRIHLLREAEAERNVFFEMSPPYIFKK